MQLKKLYIKDYKILKNFTIEFPLDLEKSISVFIGANGSGKSTVLEAIAVIFSNAILAEKAKFGFELSYSLNYPGLKNEVAKNKVLKKTELYTECLQIVLSAEDKRKEIHVEISNDKGEPIYQGKQKEGGKLTIYDINEDKDFSIFPDNIVIYYSGLSKLLEEVCKPHNEALSKAYRNPKIVAKRDFFYFQPEHFNIILLSLLSYEYGDVPEFLKEKAKISGFQSISIKLQKPEWVKDTIKNFWGADGEVRRFLDYLNENKTTLEELKGTVKPDKPGGLVLEAMQDDFIIITIVGQQRLFEIREFLVEERKLFEILNIMLVDGLLKDISFSLKTVGNKYGNFSILSEGEQQVITIKGLSEFLAGENSLFLFDEPDTYLHPEWQRQFIQQVEQNIDELNAENQYLIATHSPNIVSGIKKEQLFVLDKGEIKEIPFNSYGKNIESLLIDFFKVEGVRNKYVEQLLLEVQELVKLKKYESSEFKTKFEELKKIMQPTAPEIISINLEIAKSKKK